MPGGGVVTGEPDHIAALRAVMADRTAEALALGSAATPAFADAWGRVALAQSALIDAQAADMRRRGALIVARAREIAL